MSKKDKDKDKDAKPKSKKGFFGKMFGGKDADDAPAVPEPTEPPKDALLPAPVTPTSVQARLAVGPAERVLEAIRSGNAKELQDAILSFGSATPGNAKAAGKLRLVKGELHVGSYSLATILSRSEGSHRPRPVREDMNIDKETWEATCRLTTILVQVLDSLGKTA